MIVAGFRLPTIIDYDNILVMSEGRVSEFGTPSELLKREGVSCGLCRDLGLRNVPCCFVEIEFMYCQTTFGTNDCCNDRESCAN